MCIINRLFQIRGYPVVKTFTGKWRSSWIQTHSQSSPVFRIQDGARSLARSLPLSFLDRLSLTIKQTSVTPEEQQKTTPINVEPT